MLHLCSGRNKEGYLHALIKGFDVTDAPAKSSLCKVRKKISSQFFGEYLSDLLKSFKRPTWRRLHLYATDGVEFAIPRTEEILDAGYRGRVLTGGEVQTYYPHLYLVHTYDVLSRTTKAINFGPRSNEIKGALLTIPELETNSLTIYDRFYSNMKVMRAHFDSENHFLIRFRRAKFGVPKEVTTFFESKKTMDSFLLEGHPDRRIYLYKLKHPTQKEVSVFATDRQDLGKRAIRELYRLRWEVETSFRDLVETLRIEQWHAKDVNGIEQEVYMRFWIMNFARIHQFNVEKADQNPLARTYSRSNFKLILDFIVGNIFEFFRKSKKILQKLKLIIARSTERRKHYSRVRPRQIRFNPSNHKAANVVPYLRGEKA